MTFRNPILLVALAALIVPILIHLLRRGRARSVDWGAMQFLLASLALRNRRTLLEEIILLAVRCLLLAMLVLAMARPFLPSTSAVPWPIILPAALLAALSMALGTAMWARPLRRWALFALAAVLLGAAAAGTIWETRRQRSRWTASAAQQDIAIVVDASMSMGLQSGGKRNFARAVQEARDVVAAARRGDAISLILAGPVPRRIVPAPTSDHKKVLQALDTLSGPTGGPMAVLAGLNAASASLADGNNLPKWIVLITDCQDVGWDLRNTERWRFLASSLRDMPQPPRIIVRTLGLPERYSNAAITDVRLSRKVIGADRSVAIDVKVLNSGAASLIGAGVTLSIDAKPLPPMLLGELRPNAAETVRFQHRFEHPGPHVVTAVLDCKDDLPGDNTVWRVVNVIEKLPVLIVDGAPAQSPQAGAGTFVELALTPRGPAVRHRRGLANDSDSDEDITRYLVEPTTIPAPDVASVRDFGVYRLIVLANVAKLPRAAAERVADFVREGGGLLIAPGDLARREFYNLWKGRAGRRVTPALLDKRHDLGIERVKLSPRTFSHPALELLADPAYCRDGLITSYWRMAVDDRDVSVSVAARIETGEPFLVERKLGKGSVLMTAVSLDRHDSNLPSLKPFFVPLVHEMTYFLASDQASDANVPPGAEVALTVPLRPAPSEAGGAKAAPALSVGDSLAVAMPSTRQRQARLTDLSNTYLRARFSETDEPGLYRLILPEGLTLRLTESIRRSGAARRGWPFVVRADPAEGRLTALRGEELAAVREHGVALLAAQTPDELTAIIRGGVPGQELWRPLALAVLLALLAEVLLTRWIAHQRKGPSAQAVEFSQQDPATLEEILQPDAAVRRPQGAAEKV